MPGEMKRAVQRPRISLDVTPTVRRRIRLAAAKRDVSIQQYILGALQERLAEDLGDEEQEVLAMTLQADPVLASLWDNVKDAAYDRL